MGFYDSVRETVQDQEETHRHTKRSDKDQNGGEETVEHQAGDTVREHIINETGKDDRDGTGNDLKQGDETQRDEVDDMDELIKQARENAPPDPNENTEQHGQEEEDRDTSMDTREQAQNPASQHQQNAAPVPDQQPEQSTAQQEPGQEQGAAASPGTGGQQSQEAAEQRRADASDINEEDIPTWMKNEMQQPSQENTEEQDGDEIQSADTGQPVSQTVSDGERPGADAVHGLLNDIKQQNQEMLQHLRGIRNAVEQAT